MSLDNPIYMSDIIIKDDSEKIDISATRLATQGLFSFDNKIDSWKDLGYVEGNAQDSSDNARLEAIKNLKKNADELGGNLVYGFRIEEDDAETIAKGYCALFEPK